MSQEWDEVKNEVNLMAGMLDAFYDDLKAARDSGVLTERQIKAVDLMMGQAIETEFFFKARMGAMARVEAAEAGGE